MLESFIFAGFGGQGVLTAGMLTASVAHYAGMQVTWFPSYGSEMRGGTANCSVKISDEFIATPYIKEIDILFTLNEPAVDKFESQVKKDGFMFVNSSLASEGRTYRSDIKVVSLPIIAFCDELKNQNAANILMLGAMSQATGVFSGEVYKEAMCDYFAKKGKDKFNAMNVEAFDIGYNAAAELAKNK